MDITTIWSSGAELHAGHMYGPSGLDKQQEVPDFQRPASRRLEPDKPIKSTGLLVRRKTPNPHKIKSLGFRVSHVKPEASWSHTGNPTGPCTQMVYTLASKVFPIKVHWGQSIYYLGT